MHVYNFMFVELDLAFSLKVLPYSSPRPVPRVVRDASLCTDPGLLFHGRRTCRGPLDFCIPDPWRREHQVNVQKNSCDG